MKFDNTPPLPDKVEVHAQKEIEKQKVLFASVTKNKGHTMYEINCETGEITEAKFKEGRIHSCQTLI